MLGLLKKLFGAKPAAETAEVPYKVETPAPETVKETPVAVTALGEPPATVVVEGAGAVEVAKEAPAKKPAPKKQQAAKKPAAQKAAKPKAPRKPKAKPAA
jgi:hypothetical protein